MNMKMHKIFIGSPLPTTNSWEGLWKENKCKNQLYKPNNFTLMEDEK